MKELSIEEKAKAYDEAIERAKGVIEQNPLMEYLKKGIEYILPELKESEDEKIRKALINQFSDYKRRGENHGFGYSNDKILAWLEKQGDQDNNEDSNILQRFSFYSYKDEPNILYLSSLYVNEEYRNNGIGTKILEVADEVAKSLNCHAIRLKTKKDSDAERLYRTHGYNSLVVKDKGEIWLEKQCEPKPACKMQVSDELYEHIRNTCACIDDALSSKSFADINDYLSMAEHSAQSAFDMIEKQCEQKPDDKAEPKFKVGDTIAEKHNSDIHNFGSFAITDITGGKYWYNDRIICDISEQDEWEIYEPVRQKSTEWSEGDEIMLDNAIVACNRCYFSKTANWLKSLKTRYTWKPSDEQITWLYRAADNASKDSRMKQVLNNLLSDLKKLREE